MTRPGHHGPRDMGRRLPAGHRRGRTSERGVAMVELAFVAMLLLLMVAGTFDYGFAWRSGLAANEAARTGARVASGQGTSAGADYYALNGVRASLTASGQINNVKKIVIFRSTTANGRVPTTCLATAPSGACNVLTKAQLQALTSASYSIVISADPTVAPTGTGCLLAGSASLAGWCPNARIKVPQASADYVGVYVELFYKNQFPILGSGTTVTRTAVMRIEPV